MAKWVEYTGSDEQIEELANTKTSARVKYKSKSEVMWSYTLFSGRNNIIAIMENATAYLICEPHPYADIIKIWAETGCEVWVRYEWRDSTGPHCETYVTDEPDWNIPGAKYRLTPFEESL